MTVITSQMANAWLTQSPVVVTVVSTVNLQRKHACTAHAYRYNYLYTIRLTTTNKIRGYLARVTLNKAK